MLLANTWSYTYPDIQIYMHIYRCTHTRIYIHPYQIWWNWNRRGTAPTRVRPLPRIPPSALLSCRIHLCPDMHACMRASACIILGYVIPSHDNFSIYDEYSTKVINTHDARTHVPENWNPYCAFSLCSLTETVHFASLLSQRTTPICMWVQSPCWVNVYLCVHVGLWVST